MHVIRNQKKVGCLATDGRVLQGSRLPKSGVPRLGQWHPYYSRCSAFFFGVSAWPAFFVSEDSIAFATDFCNTPPPKVGCMDLFCILDTSSDDLGRHSGRRCDIIWMSELRGSEGAPPVVFFGSQTHLTTVISTTFPSYCMLLKLETNLSIVWEPHIAPDLSFQIPSTGLNPSYHYELSDYNIIQPITTPMATIHRWIWWNHQYPSISKVFTIVEIPTVDGRNPASPWMVIGKKYLSTGAGFLPSTVLLTAKESFSDTPISYQIPQFSLWSIARCHTMLNYQYTHLYMP